MFSLYFIVNIRFINIFSILAVPRYVNIELFYNISWEAYLNLLQRHVEKNSKKQCTVLHPQSQIR